MDLINKEVGMKRIIICLLSVLLGGMAHLEAQIKFGVKGGLNISSVHLNSDILEADNVTGFQIGPMMETMIPFFGLGFDAAILYAQKGMALNSGESVKTSYLDVPINLKWKFGLPLAKLFVAAGPYFDFRIGGDKFWEVPGSVAEQVKAKTFSAGLNVGAGAELFSHLQVGFNYGWGLTDNYSSEQSDINAKNRGWSITAAILF